MSLSPTSRVVVSDQQVFTTVGGEAVVLGLRDGVYYGLDSVGARIWALLVVPRRVSEIVDAIVAEFEVTPQQCERDVLALLTDLATRDLIQEAPGDDDAALP